MLCFRFLIGEDTLGSGKDCDTHSVENLGKIVHTCVDAKTGCRNSLKTGDDLLSLDGSVFECDDDVVLNIAVNNFKSFDVTFFYEVSAIATLILLAGTSTVSCFAVKHF